METLHQDIERHYYKKGLFEEIIGRLKEKGIDLASVKRSDIAAVDEFHVRGAAVSKELAREIDMHRLDVLDIGCGLGGACRMLADEFNCTVTGIDLSREYIRTARALSKLVKIDHKTIFKVGDAVDLPFGDQVFDVVWTQHVQMNVPDKKKFYSEITRVLKSQGHFLYYDIFKNNDREVTYPMPWASSADHSFLFKNIELHTILNQQGFRSIAATDQTKAGIEFFEALLARLEQFGPPKIGLNVLMGASTKTKLLNLLHHLKKGSLILESGIYKKEQPKQHGNP